MAKTSPAMTMEGVQAYSDLLLSFTLSAST